MKARKWGSFIAVSFLAIFIVGGMCACDEMNKKEIELVSRQAGMFTSVGWIAAEDPDQGEVDSMLYMLDVIADKAANVTSNVDFTVALYPQLIEVIEEDIEPRYRPLCKVSCITFLGGLDMLFVVNADWAEEQTIVTAVVNKFVEGAKYGLALREDDPVMLKAREVAAAREDIIANDEEVQEEAGVEVIEIPIDTNDPNWPMMIGVAVIALALGYRVRILIVNRAEAKKKTKKKK